MIFDLRSHHSSFVLAVLHPAHHLPHPGAPSGACPGCKGVNSEVLTILLSTTQVCGHLTGMCRMLRPCLAMPLPDWYLEIHTGCAARTARRERRRAQEARRRLRRVQRRWRRPQRGAAAKAILMHSRQPTCQAMLACCLFAQHPVEGLMTLSSGSSRSQQPKLTNN